LGIPFWKKESTRRLKLVREDKDVFLVSGTKRQEKIKAIEAAIAKEEEERQQQTQMRKAIIKGEISKPNPYLVTSSSLATNSTNSTAIVAVGSVKQVGAASAANPVVPVQKKASERLAELQKQQEHRELEEWRKEHEKSKVFVEYINAYGNKGVVDAQLQTKTQQKSPSVDDIAVITNLRYNAAVALKSGSL
jgi:hypothetical protein